MSRQKYPQPVKQEEAKAFKLRHQIKARNVAQELYLESLRNYPITFCNGPAGTGKTYLVMGVALEKLMNNEVTRIVVTRPIVEAGEHLGFLPGTLEEKINPYLLPILDAVEDHIGPTMTKKLIDSGKIEVAPLAYMRGRTLNDAFVVLDEAQNTTKEQMNMFLTRLGYGSIFCINGDPQQSDLPKHNESGLNWAISRLKGVNEKIQVIEFHKSDIVRHPLISVMLDYLESPVSTITPVSRINGKSRYDMNSSAGMLLTPNTETLANA